MRNQSRESPSAPARLLLPTLSCGLAWLILAGTGWEPLYRSAAHAQVRVAIAAEPQANPDDPKRAFVLPSQSAEVAEALEDFARHSKRSAWDRAFKSLQKVLEANAGGLVATPDGFLLSIRTRLWQSLAELPPDGKAAYRLFYDAEAKKLLAEAQGAPEQEKLGKVFTSYFASSVGDVAADRLGDLYFEQGEMGKAGECWQAVLDYRPDSAIPRVRLLVKTAIALARAGRWREFRSIEHAVRARHAGEAVTLGGKECDAAEHLASLAPPAEPTDSQANIASSRDLELAEQTEPVWQFRYFSEANAKAIASAREEWGPQSAVSSMVPPMALDDSRIYVNLLGHHLALELATGKLLWRSARFHDVAQKVRNQPYYVRPEQYGIVAAGGKVFCVSRSAQQLGQHNTPFRLSCLNGEDGKVMWTSESVAELKEWSFTGSPLATSDRIFACCSRPQKATELHLMAVQPDTGKPLWTVLVGTHQVDQNQMYYQQTAQPSLLLHEGKVYVDTHSGALAEVSGDTGNLDWGFAYESEVPNTQYWVYNQAASVITAGPPIVAGGTLYLKGMRSPRLYAVQLSEPKLAWQRPVSKSEMLAGVDGERLYLSGEELTAISLADQRLRWSTKVPLGTGTIRPVVTDNRIYQFTPRGVFEVDKANGDVLRVFRGADLGSLGGMLFVTPKGLVTVSNIGVTVYALRALESAARADSDNALDATGAKTK